MPATRDDEDIAATAACDGRDSAGRVARATKNHGEVRVNTQVVGFKKIKFGTMENLGSGELSLPEQEMHTTAYWLALSAALLRELPFSSDERLAGVGGLARALQAIATLLLMCDARDLGVAIGETSELANQKSESRSQKTEAGKTSVVPAKRDQSSVAKSAGERTTDHRLRTTDNACSDAEFEPTIYLYDKYPGGIGFSEPLFRLSEELLENTRQLIKNCPCTSGCPSCVGPAGEVGEKGKEAALAILKELSVVRSP